MTSFPEPEEQMKIVADLKVENALLLQQITITPKNHEVLNQCKTSNRHMRSGFYSKKT